jgi:hypothetical protein
VPNDPPSGVRPDVMAAVELALGGRADDARRCFDALWGSLEVDDGFHRCVVAHYMADLQTDSLVEREWDQRTLDCALRSPPESLDDRIPEVTGANLLPSLYLNLAAVCERVGDLEAARLHAVAARQSLDDVPRTALGGLTRSAIERLCERLGMSARSQTR